MSGKQLVEEYLKGHPGPIVIEIFAEWIRDKVTGKLPEAEVPLASGSPGPSATSEK
jgi:hypothetical protein